MGQQTTQIISKSDNNAGISQALKCEEEYVEHRGKGVVFLITMAIVFAIAAALQIWFFTVVLCAFRYLRDDQAVTSRGNPIFHYSSRNIGSLPPKFSAKYCPEPPIPSLIGLNPKLEP
uniref:Uncharacterized protein n=1 Tax=Romanomermis culicivorax TaxID=13658 RepID=A0A915KC33_ROMCU